MLPQCERAWGKDVRWSYIAQVLLSIYYGAVILNSWHLRLDGGPVAQLVLIRAGLAVQLPFPAVTVLLRTIPGGCQGKPARAG